MSRKLTYITLKEKDGILRLKEPITCGVCFPRGIVKNTEELSLLDPQGAPLPCQWKVLLRWPDQSIKWVLCDFLAELKPHETKRYSIALKPKQQTKTPLRLSKERDEILIHTGPATFKCSKQSPWLTEITLGGKSLLDITRSIKGLTNRKEMSRKGSVPDFSAGKTGTDPQTGRGFSQVKDAPSNIQSTWQLLGIKKEPAHFVVENIQVEDSGPVRCTIGTTGHIISKKQDLRLWFYQRLSFFTGLPLIKVEFTIRNPRRAKHRGGLWDLGDLGSMYIKDLSLLLRPNSGFRHVIFSTEPESPITRSIKGLTNRKEMSRKGSVPDFSVRKMGTDPQTGRRLCRVKDTPSNKRHGSPPLKIYQDSSGGELWQSPVHVNRFGMIPLTFRGYRLTHPGGEEQGLRATPLIKALTEDGGEIALAMSHFWQNFPKALEVKAHEIRLGLFPEEFADLHEIQGGEQKTHVFWLAFGSDENPAPDLNWVVAPLVPILDPEWISQSKVLLYFSPAITRSIKGLTNRKEMSHKGSVPDFSAGKTGTDPQTGCGFSQVKDAPSNKDLPDYADIVKAGLEGPNSFFIKREKIDEYGWRNFGDVYADHETPFYKGDLPLVSHYNNQYDLVYSFLLHFLRSEDPRWFQLGTELASHVYDIDIYHTNEDKPAYNHGLFWHTFHYVHAYRSTHRCYSRDAGVVGGGPSNEHLYSSGLLLHYLLTGDPRARDAVIKFGDHVIEMDKPLKILRWLDKGPSGLASQTRDPWYHGPGRGAGNSINCLLDAYLLTERRTYLEKAEELIRRCIHPKDDLEALGLRQPEERWSYTVFLQVLGKYLFLKAEKAEFDYMFAYAREALLHYARWMAENEYIYLDRPELLEYPTETWAAQEIRKAEVFNLAAYFTNSQEERRPFREKARFFYEESLKRLRSFPTWTYTRPLAIILQSGFSYAWFQRHKPPTWPEASYEFGEPQKFVPQKLRVKQKLLRLVSLGKK